ncbi:zinc finger CCCH domain-containing protein 11A-like isoform X1 [Acanthochromis polyacanthus]|uniref:zinc finger CCCH domain-containing protein 11A-like isoform X1 n=1 Tax=Acanthochromis polyacanthus TaxID=80966 RepID=UPI002233FAC2|nr:zinc finger CCCH domain-containing protein 11A-like isoform X1 [Acanthochromis polyacanthus]XP_051804215.1 zinc finger CCCH domain-containing protein 11A-like isoform X1 [Acanthochromis polyacanthus]
MTNHGDDCYFFYYSTCTKGESCPFRHCEAAMGNETVCSLWQERRCFRTVCKFRHMEITKNRKEIHCYWENQPAGCQKPHCAFFHEKPRFVEGTFVPPDKNLVKDEEQQHEEPVPPPAAPLHTTTNPQLRGVIKTESQEPVPSPTHPPVVINPADDDEDEDDQFSEEGEDSKIGPSPRKLLKSGDSLNFGVSTLEEILLRKALKASMRRAGYPVQSGETSANGEKENIQSLFQPALLGSRDDPLVFEEAGRPRTSVAERLGRRIPHTEGVPLKRSLAERLGHVVDAGEPSVAGQKALKPIKERLGLLSDAAAPTQPAETSVTSKKFPEQIRIKTLEEIKQEKAAKSQSHKDASSATPPEVTMTKTKGIKRAITVTDASVGQVKMFSEILQAKKRMHEKEQEPKTRLLVEEASGESHGESETADGEVRVKTLEEIRREKAARIQAQQTAVSENKKSSDTEDSGAKKPRLLRIKKLTPQITHEKNTKVSEKPLKPPAAVPETSNNVKVKTFEEIMREKHLRKQEIEEQAKSSAEAEASPKQTSSDPQRRKLPAKISVTSSGPSSPSLSPATQRVPVRKLIPLRSRAASHLNNTAAPDESGSAVPAVSSAPSSNEVPHTNTRVFSVPSAAKQARAAPQGPAAETSTADEDINNDQKKSPEHPVDTKVRPKLNVKPSVMKPAVQLKPGQKRRGAARSAVAAVKPLNSASAVSPEPLQETTCRDRQVSPSFSAEAQLSSSVSQSPAKPPDFGSSSSPLREELQTVPVFRQSSDQEAKAAVNLAVAAREACTVPQSPVLKAPQSKPRRPSAAASRAASTSTMVDIEELMNEFTDDHLGDDMDPSIGEDDLLQELSEMIDS